VIHQADGGREEELAGHQQRHGKPDSALTIRLSKRKVLSLLLNEVTVSASWTEIGSWFHKRGA